MAAEIIRNSDVFIALLSLPASLNSHSENTSGLFRFAILLHAKAKITYHQTIAEFHLLEMVNVPDYNCVGFQDSLSAYAWGS